MKTLDVMVQVFSTTLDCNARMDLERRLRMGAGAEDGAKPHSHGHGDHGHGHGHGHGHSKEKQDRATRLIEYWTKADQLRDMVPGVMEKTNNILEGVKAKGQKDGMVMDAESEKHVRKDILKEALIREVVFRVQRDNAEEQGNRSTDGGILATPAGFQGSLENLTPATIKSLMERGFGLEDDWLDSKVVGKLYKEMELLEFDGKFIEISNERMRGTRTDKLLWRTLDQFDREKQPGLCALSKKMMSIPFELNKKCSLLLQVSAHFQLAVYSADHAHCSKHLDGGYGDRDNGRKISAIFYVTDPSRDESHGGALRMYKRHKNPYELEKLTPEEAKATEDATDEVDEDLVPKPGRLVLLRSRDMPHEVLENRRKRFAVSLYLFGPPGPGDQPDGYHAKR